MASCAVQLNAIGA